MAGILLRQFWRVIEYDAAALPQLPATLPAKKRGRKPGPPRCVIQLRIRSEMGVNNLYSKTVFESPFHVMKFLQEAFTREGLFAEKRP